MNLTESMKILAVLRNAYPIAYKDSDPSIVAEIWQKIFAQTPYADVSNAVIAYMATEVTGYPPTPGQINSKIYSVKNEGISDQDAWLLVRKAISNSYYGSVEEFAKLPATVQKAVGTHYALKEWGRVDEDEVATVVRSNFCRTYRQVVEREKENAMIPEAVKAVLQSIGENKKVVGYLGQA